MKESIKKIKEAKAVFIFNSFPNNYKGLSYMKVKDFIMRHFKTERIDMNRYIIEQGTKADRLFVIKQGTFALIK